MTEGTTTFYYLKNHSEKIGNHIRIMSKIPQEVTSLKIGSKKEKKLYPKKLVSICEARNGGWRGSPDQEGQKVGSEKSAGDSDRITCISRKR